MEELKGFIEVTEKINKDNKIILHYTQIHFINRNNNLDSFFGRIWLRESYEEIKQLIKKAQ